MSKSDKKTAGPLIRKEKVPAKVVLDGKSDIELGTMKGSLKDAFVIAVITSGKVRQFTCHHPIGVTDLDPHDWVVTNSDDVRDLLDRSTDPDVARLQTLRRKRALAMAVAAGHVLTGKDGLLYYPGEELRCREGLIELARIRATKSIEGAVKEWEKLQNGAEAGKVKKPQPPDFLGFMDDKHQEGERVLREFINSDPVKEELEIQYPQNFRTQAGPFQDRPQYRANEKNKKLSPQEAADSMVRGLACVRLEGGTDVQPRGKGAVGEKSPPPKPKEDSGTSKVQNPPKGATDAKSKGTPSGTKD